jgi:hypothetical protein
MLRSCVRRAFHAAQTWHLHADRRPSPTLLYYSFTCYGLGLLWRPHFKNAVYLHMDALSIYSAAQSSSWAHWTLASNETANGVCSSAPGISFVPNDLCKVHELIDIVLLLFVLRNIKY